MTAPEATGRAAGGGGAVRVVCPICGVTVTAHYPAGGDGSGVRPDRHPRGAPPRKECDGTYAIVDAGVTP